MTIGIEASLAFNKKKAGPDNYYAQIIKHLLNLPSNHFFKLYVKGNVQADPQALGLTGNNYQIVRIPWKRLWTQGGLALECLVRPPDVLFIPAHTMPILRLPWLKTVVTIHDLGAEFLPEYHKFPQKYYLNFSTEYAAAHATKLIAISKSTKDDLIKKLKVKSQKIEVVYEGYNKELYRDFDNKVSILKHYDIEKNSYFLFIGTVQPRKNLERSIEAFAAFLQSSKGKKFENLVFAIVGQKGWLSDPIYELPKKLGIEKQVKFLGYVPDEDLPSLYANAVAFIYPSLFEGFGLPILEAQASGCPVLTSTTSSTPEVAGKGAILVDPYSTSSITQGMQVIITPEIAKKLRQDGLENIKRFSWEKAARETLGVIEGVTKN